MPIRLGLPARSFVFVVTLLSLASHCCLSVSASLDELGLYSPRVSAPGSRTTPRPVADVPRALVGVKPPFRRSKYTSSMGAIRYLEDHMQNWGNGGGYMAHLGRILEIGVTFGMKEDELPQLRSSSTLMTARPSHISDKSQIDEIRGEVSRWTSQLYDVVASRVLGKTEIIFDRNGVHASSNSVGWDMFMAASEMASVRRMTVEDLWRILMVVKTASKWVGTTYYRNDPATDALAEHRRNVVMAMSYIEMDFPAVASAGRIAWETFPEGGHRNRKIPFSDTNEYWNF